MEKVFVADKSSFGVEFYDECNTLDELKKAIVYHEIGRHSQGKYTHEMYTEELFKEHSTYYKVYEIDLHPEEEIQWHEYDGQSYFKIEKKVRNILSISTRIRD